MAGSSANGHQYTLDRKQFGPPLAATPLVQTKLADNRLACIADLTYKGWLDAVANGAISSGNAIGSSNSTFSTNRPRPDWLSFKIAAMAVRLNRVTVDITPVFRAKSK